MSPRAGGGLSIQQRTPAQAGASVSSGEPPRRRGPQYPAASPREGGGLSRQAQGLPIQARLFRTPKSLRKTQPQRRAAIGSRKDTKTQRGQRSPKSSPSGESLSCAREPPRRRGPQSASKADPNAPFPPSLEGGAGGGCTTPEAPRTPAPRHKKCVSRRDRRGTERRRGVRLPGPPVALRFAGGDGAALVHRAISRAAADQVSPRIGGGLSRQAQPSSSGESLHQTAIPAQSVAAAPCRNWFTRRREGSSALSRGRISLHSGGDRMWVKDQRPI